MEYIKAINKLIFPSNNMCYLCKDRENLIKDFICCDCREHLEILNRKVYIDSKDIDWVYYSLMYNRKMREIVTQYKFHKKSYLYKPLGKLMIDTINLHNLKEEIDLLVYVPIHGRKEAIRGYNQCELLGNFISKELNIPISHNNFYKIKNTKSQNKLDKSHRLDNLKDSFGLKDSRGIEDRRILLLDDIITTGSTMIECGGVLKKAGAKNIIGIALTSSKKI